MRTVWFLVAICGASIGCGAKIAQTTYDPTKNTAADGATAPKAPPSCGPTLKERLSITWVDVDDDIRYRRPGYGGIPRDERVAFSVLSNGAGQVAWLDNALAAVHVTPLTPEQKRAGEDEIVDGFDLGGLVAHDDGFAVLTRRNDLGEPIGNIPDAGTTVAPAAFLVRRQGGRETFAAPLTGTLNITNARPDQRRDCSTGLFGKLGFNGSVYGSYFVVRGCAGDFADGAYGDKLVYADAAGKFVPEGWTWRCSQNLGLSLLPEVGAPFTALCLTDTYPQPGLNLVSSQWSRLLAHEFTATGYSGGELGSVVKLNDGRYFVAWASRGVVRDSSRTEVAMDSHDIGFVVLSSDYIPLTRAWWLISTPNVDEVNVHAAPYGDRVLVTWETVTSPQCRSGVCLGQHGGTHLQLFDADGRAASSEEIVQQAPPNSGDDIVVFPDNDLGWAFVTDTHDPSAPLEVTNGVPNVPPIRRLGIARFEYCIGD